MCKVYLRIVVVVFGLFDVPATNKVYLRDGCSFVVIVVFWSVDFPATYKVYLRDGVYFCCHCRCCCVLPHWNRSHK